MSEPDIDDDPLLFTDEEESAERETGLQLPPWRILIVDDDPDVHKTTEYALEGMLILDRPLEFLHAFSGAEALDKLLVESHVAVVLLDVVMENATAGLDVIPVMREKNGILTTRIILRTGQPGMAPDVETVRHFDINDYHTKSELTQNRLYVAMSTAIRAYDQLENTASNQSFLERVIDASDRLVGQPDLKEFAAGLLLEMAFIVGVELEGVVLAVTFEGDGEAQEETFRVIASTTMYEGCMGHTLNRIRDVTILGPVIDCIELQANIVNASSFTLYLSGRQHGTVLVARLFCKTEFAPINPRLLDMFCRNIALGAHRVALTEKLREQAYSDPLVGLPNRNAFIEAIDACITNGTAGDRVLALLDIDQFAEINDMFGHDYADQLLIAIAQRLTHTLGQKPVFDKTPAANWMPSTIARIGSDTFGILGRGEDIPPVLLNSIFSAPFEIGNDNHVVSVGMGLLRLNESSGKAANQLKDVSIALKRAKMLGTGKFAWHSPEMGQESRARTQMLHSLREALARKELYPVFQPQIDLATHRIIGFESLLRWRTADGRFIPPDAFIPIAESSGLIVEIGAWVMRAALRAAAEFRKAGLDGFHMAVNVSVVQMRHPEFLEVIDAALRDTGTRPQDLEVEITESVALQGGESVAEVLAALKARGIPLAIDDFGTGYSSLSHLDQLPADRIKIDKSFVWALDSGQKGERIAEMVIPLGRQLGMKVLAEGAETARQIERLRELGCDEVQGYHYSKPLPQPEVIAWAKAFHQ